MNWILSVVLIALAVYTVAIYRSRERHKSALSVALAKVREQSNQLAAMEQKKIPLTQAKPKAQDVPKRLSGSQLRRLAEHVNVETMASLQERPNSEILQEQETNG